METKQTRYTEPVSQLLTFGKCDVRNWRDYAKWGLTQNDIPDLIRVATDPELAQADPESLELWAPIHAWRALGQLRAAEAVEPLLALLQQEEEKEWATEELPEVFAMIGAPAIPALVRSLPDTSHDEYFQGAVARALMGIGRAHPETRDEVVAVLTRQLERFSENDVTFNGFLISSLIDLEAVESIDAIRKAFASEAVDLFIAGDVEDVEMELGLRDRRAPLIGVSGGVTGPGSGKKTGRNDPCPCGSGKKYKKCCLNRAV